MRAVILILLVLTASVTPDTADESSPNIIMRGPHGEVATEETPYFFVEDDDGNLQKAYVTPMNGTVSAPPVFVNEEVIKFHLWTRKTTSAQGELLIVGDAERLRASTFNRINPTKFVVHGFGNTFKSDAIQGPKTAYMARGDYNVIGMDWGALCTAPWYSTAKRNTIPAGYYLGDMVKFLVDLGGANLEDIHLIGHSLGAHVCGIAGYSLGEHKVSRVTGLDPAGPEFLDTPPEDRLDATDAVFVDAIHTCGGYGLPELGLMDPTAMADFYPNGGVYPQPTCDSGDSMLGGIIDFLTRSNYSTIPCSHSYAHVLWKDSIRQKHHDRFRAFGPVSSLFEMKEIRLLGNKDGLDLMGEDASHSMRGIYKLSTVIDFWAKYRRTQNNV